MKRILSFLLACMLCLSLFSSAMAEETVGGPDSKPFAPFENTLTIKAVRGYTATDDKRPSTCYWNDMLMEFLNVDVNWLWEVPSDQYPSKLSMTLASGNYPDMLQADFQTFNYLREAGALADLTEVWNEYASPAMKKNFTEKDFANVTFDGKLLAIPYPADAAERIHIMYYRTDWLKNVGMELPQSLDDFTAVIKAFRDNDPDGNGEKDTYGLAMYSNPLTGNLSYQPVFYAFNSYPSSWILRDGKLVNGLVQDETKAALDYLRGLYSEGYIDPEFATLSSDQAKMRITDSKLGIMSHYWYAADYGWMVDNMRNDESATWEAQPMVGLEAGKPAKMKMPENTAESYMVAFTTASKDAQIAMIKMLNLFYDYNFSASVEEGGPGHVYYNTKYAPDSEEYQAIEKRFCAWCLPVVTWGSTICYNECLTQSKYYATGEWDDSIHKYSIADKEAKSRLIDSIHLNRADVDVNDAEAMETWFSGQGLTLSRVNTENTECSISVASRLKNEGYVELNRFYGAETETGNAVSSTLTDLATEYIIRYIMGTESEDSWETFVSNWYQMGGEAWTQEVNAAYASIH